MFTSKSKVLLGPNADLGRRRASGASSQNISSQSDTLFTFLCAATLVASFVCSLIASTDLVQLFLCSIQVHCRVAYWFKDECFCEILYPATGIRFWVCNVVHEVQELFMFHLCSSLLGSSQSSDISEGFL